jgi:hypothetical protein
MNQKKLSTAARLSKRNRELFMSLSRWLILPMAGFLLASQSLRAEELDPKYKDAIDKGLKWVAKNQQRDGHWDANGGQYPTTMTALGGMVLLMEGSTMKDGKYADNIRKAVDWFMEPGRCQRNGLIGNPNNPTESARYMYGHGFGLLFLSQVYGEEEDAQRRKKLEGILARAVEFTGKAQTNRGGWGYVSANEGGGFDEGSVTVTQVQALRAARDAGVPVPKAIIDKAHEYLKNCTTEAGGVIYSLAQGGRAVRGGERPPLTAAAIACMFSAGEYESPLAKKWLEYCKTAIPIAQAGRSGHDEYMQYYYAQAMYILGDKGYEKLFPQSNERDRLTWKKYRDSMFKHLVSTQGSDGSWTGGYIGPIFTTATHLTILQLENGTLPIYQR